MSGEQKTGPESELENALHDAGPDQVMLLLRKLAGLNLVLADRLLRPARWRKNRNPLNGDCAQSTEDRRNIEWLMPWALVQWLEHHPGGRLIIKSDCIELCARNLEGLEPDTDRYISCDASCVEGALASLDNMVEEMLDWEMNGWKYSFTDEEAQRLLGTLGFDGSAKDALKS